MRRVREWVLVGMVVALAAACPEKKADEGGEHAGQGEAAVKGGAASQPAGNAPAAKGDRSVHFVWPQDGSTVPETFTVVFGVKNLEVVPAGEGLNDPNKGHHHVVIDGKPIPAKTMVPKDEKNIHFGKGQTQAELKLAPGEHTLTMQFADAAHMSYGPDLSSTIKVTVVAAPKDEMKVMFEAPQDGAKVKSPVKVVFGVSGMTVKPAGEEVLNKLVGHHHVVIDGEAIPAGTMVPKDDKNIHFGGGQTEAELKLDKGKHTLTMQFADGAHMSYGEKMSSTITVEVE